jgi:hypothetical protein
MNKPYSRTQDRSRIRSAPSQSGDEIQYLLRAEEQILHAIAAHVPVLDILNEICIALDCQIGNMVSLISLPEDDAAFAVEIARNAAFFGLHTFCSEGIVADNDEVLGFLEMYCTVPRRPSANEVELIERAKCLIAIAIKCEIGATHNDRGFALERPSRQETMPKEPVYLN